MSWFFNAYQRLMSLIQQSKPFRDGVNSAFESRGFPPVFVETSQGLPAIDTRYRIDLIPPPRMVWFQLAEIYIDYLPESKELTYDPRSNTITRIGPIPEQYRTVK